jgi:hypothetical protein
LEKYKAAIFTKLLDSIKRNFTETVEREISYFKIGEAQFVTNPGETATFYSLESK